MGMLIVRRRWNLPEEAPATKGGDLSSKTRAELVELAREKGIDVRAKATKAELEKLISEA